MVNIYIFHLFIQLAELLEIIDFYYLKTLFLCNNNKNCVIQQAEYVNKFLFSFIGRLFGKIFIEWGINNIFKSSN